MIDSKRAVIFLDEEGAEETKTERPLLFRPVLFCPMLTWLSDALRREGVERFFVLCAPEEQEEALSCFYNKENVTVSDRWE